MLFNGHTQDTIEAIDEDVFNQIAVMYGDGMIGNGGMLQGIGSLTAGVFNYMRSPTQPAYSLKSVLGNQYDYIFNEPEIDPSEALKGFVALSRGFAADKFKKG